jgi:uncharacterized membrane protein YhfC
VYLFRKLAVEWRLFGVGVVTFIASQVLHIPFNAWVLDPVIRRLGLELGVPVQLAVIALLFGLSAGVFEEIARYIVYRLSLKDEGDRSWGSALMFGAGHGGIESIILGVLVAYGFIQLFALKNANLETLIPVHQLEIARAQIDMYWSAPWYAAILGAVERAAALCFHLSASVLVMQVFKRENILWLFLAILWHTLINALAVFASQTWSIYLAEALIVGAGLFGLAIIFFLQETAATPDEQPPPQPGDKLVEIETQKPSLDHLEDSRYV